MSAAQVAAAEVGANKDRRLGRRVVAAAGYAQVAVRGSSNATVRLAAVTEQRLVGEDNRREYHRR